MARTMRPASLLDVHRLKDADDKLRDALTFVRAAGAPRTEERIRRARTSLQGAIRHAEHRLWRTEPGKET